MNAEPDHPTIPDSAPDTSLQTPPAPPPVQAESTSPEPTEASPEDDQTHPPSSGIADELHALKLKILELEAKAQAEQAPPQLTPEQAEYLRMEECLYKHRKEWEQTTDTEKYQLWIRGRFSGWREGLPKSGPGALPPMIGPTVLPPWELPPGTVPLPTPGNRPTPIPQSVVVTSPWTSNWAIEYKQPYQPPDPFHPIHKDCGTNHTDQSDGEPDDYDRTIDFGSRRNRIRKTFEWEMDRLYLAEETEKRKRDARKRETEKNVSGDENPKENIIVKHAKPTLNRTNWASFRRFAMADLHDTHAIEVLIGEPAIYSKNSTKGWYGSGRHSRKVEKPLDRKVVGLAPGQEPLPERIRIHSVELLYILNRVLATGELTHCFPKGPFVLIRPFKLLVYCELGLREWHKALEEKLSNSSEPIVPDSAPDSLEKKEPAAVEQPRVKVSSQTTIEGRLSTDESKVTISETTDDGQYDETQSKPKKQEQRQEDADGEDSASESDSDSDSDAESGFVAQTKSPTALAHLKCLIEFLDTDISEKRRYLNGENCRTVVFSDLWHLFRPGMEVIGNDGKQAYRVIEVNSAAHSVGPIWDSWYSSSKDKKNKSAFSVTCVYVDFDGSHLGPVSKTFAFKRFEGEKDITSFEVYPLRFRQLINRAGLSDAEWKHLEAYPPTERFRQRLINRGSKFLEAAAVKHMYYAGPTLEVREEVESQVVIDFETAFSFEDESKYSMKKPVLEVLIGNDVSDEDEESEYSCDGDCCDREPNVHDDTYIDEKQRSEYVASLLPKTPAQDAPSFVVIPWPLKELQTGSDNSLVVSDDELVIMSYRVFGFILRSRKWAQLDLTYLSDVQPGEPSSEETKGGEKQDGGGCGKEEPATAFDRLVLEEGHRPMIVSLISQHFRNKESKGSQTEQVDIVKGKGKGLILLLHGAPGVGKTSTAEGVAELFKKPLLQITCGDLGTTAKEVEETLETNFTLASKWGCILLLDEADVFLAERTKEDFKRNGLVAAFLRVLEYYAGILFLTTNRVGDFDEAFTSRIHISLYYPELNSDKTVEVFNINMELIEERFARNKRRIAIDKLKIGSFASNHFAEYPHARWNGRQIRNACQTALALAEFEAQGSSHEAILNPDAVVELTVEHFNTVRNAYLEFNKYMNDIYGSSTARRAKEGKLRAFYVDENNHLVGMGGGSGGNGFDRKAAFTRIVQSKQQGAVQQYGGFEQPQGYQQSQGYQQPQTYQQSQAPQHYQGVPQPQAYQQHQHQTGQQPQGFQQTQNFQQPQNTQPHSFQQPQGFQQQPSSAMQQPQSQNYSSIVSPQPGYGNPSPMTMQGQQLSGSQPANNPSSNVGGSPFQRSQPGLGEGENQPPQQIARSPTWFNQGISDMYSASGQQGTGQLPPGSHLEAGGSGFGAGHQQGNQGHPGTQ
ncbi:hypothetical protein QQX98_004548 [Neonectria punicea]|uniref:AAA+ ATPase domain-containing protein n=1 Tax=Neonectria punicea TaxID=979145 RepID=A0ABR1H8I1_9HYPO